MRYFGKEFTKKDNLLSRKRTVDYRSRDFVCLGCEKKSSTKGNFLAHKKVRSRCRQCHEQFSSPSELLHKASAVVEALYHSVVITKT